MNTLPLLAAAGLLAVALGGAAAVASTQDSDDKVTICHVPPGNPGGARTMEVPRSSWSAHEGHGDHQGACTAADRPPAPKPAPQPLPKTQLAISAQGDGELDGDASFKVAVANEGGAPGVGVRVVATLRGDGEWKLKPSGGVDCSVQEKTVTCDYADIPAGHAANVGLSFDPAGLAVCREASVDVRMTAANDSSTGDDRSRTSAWVGACSPLDHGALG